MPAGFPSLLALPSASTLTAGLLGLSAVLLLISLVMRIVTDRRRRDDEAKLTPAERIERSKQTKGMQGDLEQVVVQVQRITQELGEQVETRSRELERVMREADRRIAELRRLQGHAVDAPLPMPTRVSNGVVPGGERAQAGVEQGPGDQAPESIEALPQFSAPNPTLKEPDDPLVRTVYSLADAGQSPAEIARQLKEHVGKVELILALREA